MLEAGDRVLVGVSGGADSVALLLALKEMGYAVGIAHLNHGLRGMESDGDEQFVAELANRIGIPSFSRRITIQPAGNVEAIGRAARKEFFESVCAEHGFTKIAIAHTREDRVETCLLHLLRGAGLEGMVSMAPVHGTTVRPLIETSHEEIQHYLRAANQPWRMDASNLDTTFARNRLRHEVLPQLAASFNPRLIETLLRTVELLQDEDTWMRKQTTDWLADHATKSSADEVNAVTVNTAALNAVPVAMVRRVVRAALRMAGSDLFDISFDRIENVRHLLADGKSGKTIQMPGGLVVERVFDRLVFRQAVEASREFEYELQIPGEVHIPEAGRRFRAEIVDMSAVERASSDDPRVFVDGGRLGACVKIRNWKPGDYYKPVGWPGGKLKKLFQRARVPRIQRDRWPVFLTDSTVVWVASFPVSREFALNERSRKIVTFQALKTTSE